ncbi:MAG TPA: M1 family metallopeptidase [Puia sp.]|nr:M1 family metallopeptidase [Puia sp.]
MPKTLGLLWLATWLFCLSARPQAAHTTPSPHPYWQQRVDYTIDVTLDDREKSLDGFVRMEYTNNSPDTLAFIWIHCWPNAYKNDRTAFSEQLLGNGRTDFYFSDKQQRGYINRLDFRADGQEAKMEDHPQYIDVIKVVLPKPLPPGGHTTLTTPFHEKLPYNFSRGGWTLTPSAPQHHPFGKPPSTPAAPPTVSYQVTQWYPKPAVYDSRGWHPIPYLDQGEFYSEFGDFDVRITAPNNLIVAATGESQDTSYPSNSTRTLHYKQTRIHDFAWFADRRFHVDHDTLRLPSGRTIDVYSYYTPTAPDGWTNSTTYIKDAVRFRSALIGEYPYNTVTAVQAKMGATGGMEYPTITAINSSGPARDVDLTIEHEVGHNWFYGILGSNERRYPWMDEGINTYYDSRYEALKYPSEGDVNYPSIGTLAVQKKDQPISTPSEDFTEENYFNIAYTKTGSWMKMLEDTLGTALFDRCMQEYFHEWQFKHPWPDDFRAVITNTSHRSLDTLFALLDKKGALPPLPAHRKLKPALLFNLTQTDKYNYLGLFPAFGYNEYDHFMAGLLIHNFNLPPNPIQFYLAPLYATGSHQLNGTGSLIWSLYPDHGLQKIQGLLGIQRFSTMSGTDSSGGRLTGGYYKITPGLRIVFPKSSPRSTLETSLEWKTFLIGEKNLDHFVRKTADSLYYPVAGKYDFRYLNQLSFDLRDTRVLYPYNVRLQLQQAASWYRVNFTTNYFFNYAKGGGLDLRVFGAKFGYLGSRSPTEDLSRFEPKLTAVRGDEDYTYNNYFIGRNEFMGGASQQVLMRDGDLKIRTDLFQGLQGRSDNWVASINLRTTLPRAIVPEWLPLRAFFDAGTYSGAWENSPPTSHFLYVGGFELAILHDVIRIYAPLVYSSDFSSQLKTVPDQNTFWKRISFSVDLQNIDFRKLFGNMPF